MTSSIIHLAEAFNLTEDGTLKGSSGTARRNLSPARLKALSEAAELWQRTWDGDRLAAHIVGEALSTSDLFKSSTGDMLDRMLLAGYAEQPAVWQRYANRTTVRNFKTKVLVDLLGGRTRLDKVEQLAPYPQTASGSVEYQIAVAKFGRGFGFSWEAGINDDIDELRTIPDAFALSARLTEEYAVLESITVAGTGAPLTSFFKSYSAGAAYSAFDNSSTNALTGANFETALTNIAARKDGDGNIVPRPPLVLMVGPALEFTAKRILNAVTIRTTSGTRQTEEPNYLAGAVDEVVVNPYLAGLAWYILPRPGSQRPAVAAAFLVGHETPDIRLKAAAGTRLGGGAVPEEEGDFEHDGVFYRVRHVVGAANVDPIFTYGSTGATGTPGI